MQNQEKKYQINLPEGCTELIIREGDAPKCLNEVEPKKLTLTGTLESVFDFLHKRKDKGQFEIKDCHLIVDREDVQMILVINERDERRFACITGALSMHPDFQMLKINTSHTWVPSELGMMFKMHRYWFKDQSQGMKLISTLMNFVADVNAKVERHISENGSHGEIYNQIVNSNLPSAISIDIPVFKGEKPSTIEVETFAKIDGKQVSFMLLSPGANEILNELRNNAIDAELERIRAIAPELVIIER